MSRLPVAGTHYCLCMSCGEEWAEDSRDILSPSNVYCMSCGEVAEVLESKELKKSK